MNQGQQLRGGSGKLFVFCVIAIPIAVGLAVGVIGVILKPASISGDFRECRDVRTGEAFIFDPSKIRNVYFVSVPKYYQFTLDDTDGNARQITSDMEPYYKCKWTQLKEGMK